MLGQLHSRRKENIMNYSYKKKIYLKRKKKKKKKKEKEETRPDLNVQVSGESYFGSIF